MLLTPGEAYRSFHREQLKLIQTPDLSGFGGLGVSALASGTQVRGLKPGRSRRIFQGEKVLNAPSFGM
jgi:hypothetical protein